MVELLWVRPGRDDGRVALWEVSPLHPGGEAFVASVPVQVALTPAVERRLDSGDLVLCAPPEPVDDRPKRKTKAEVNAMITAAGGHVGDAPDTAQEPEKQGVGGRVSGVTTPHTPHPTPRSEATAPAVPRRVKRS